MNESRSNDPQTGHPSSPSGGNVEFKVTVKRRWLIGLGVVAAVLLCGVVGYAIGAAAHEGTPVAATVSKPTVTPTAPKTTAPPTRSATPAATTSPSRTPTPSVTPKATSTPTPTPTSTAGLFALSGQYNIKATSAQGDAISQKSINMPTSFVLGLDVSASGVKVSGLSPWVTVTSTYIGSNGDIIATGKGTVAGQSGVGVQLVANVSSKGLSGSYTMGATNAGAALANNQVVIYNMSGTKK